MILQTFLVVAIVFDVFLIREPLRVLFLLDRPETIFTKIQKKKKLFSTFTLSDIMEHVKLNSPIEAHVCVSGTIQADCFPLQVSSGPKTTAQ